MGFNTDIAEMLAFAAEHPEYDRETFHRYQRGFPDDLTITLFLFGESGHVWLSAPRKIRDDENAFVITTLMSLSCMGDSYVIEKGVYTRRYKFFNPRLRRPLFASELDAFLPKVLQDTKDPSIAKNSSPKSSRMMFTDSESTEKTRSLVSPPMPDSYFPERKTSIKKLYWDELPNDRCHICHRNLTDPSSIRVSIGPDCRQKIEGLEERGPEMWDDISREELEKIWTTYNIYRNR